MNNCYSCTTCKSADKPLEGYIAGLPMETSGFRVSAAVSVPTVHAALPRKRPMASAARRQT